MSQRISGMLKLADLAGRADFDVGPLHVSPSLRLIEGRAGSTRVQPIVMKVFLLLLDARGTVVTRDELFDSAWGGVFVGDDSLNRAIASARKIAAETAPGLFDIEAIPRTGYRITGEILQCLDKGSRTTETPKLSRRALVGGGAAAAAGISAAGLWWVDRSRTDPHFATLMQRGEDSLRVDEPAERYFEQAVVIEPRNAKAWGLLAYSRANRVKAMTGDSAQAAEQAARKAIELNPNEPSALLAMAFIQSSTLDQYESEERYRRILKIDPNNTLAMRSLGQLLHGVGRCRESLTIVDRALAVDPLAPDHWARKAGRLWVLGRVAEADKVIDRALQFWPSHRLVRLLRLMIYAFTGRTRAALTIIKDEEASPTFIAESAIAIWRASLAAIETPTASAIAAVRKASIDGSQGSPQIAAWAILVLAQLRELDAAFEVANGFLLDRGSVIVRPRPDPKEARVTGSGWRNTFGLFTPPTKAMRLDPRFRPLAEGLGLTDYWRRRGVGPDAFLFKA